MNSTSSEEAASHHAGAALRFGVSVGVVSLVIILIVASYLCNYKRLQLQQPPPPNTTRNTRQQYYTDDDDDDLENSPAAVDIPRIRFSEVSNDQGDCNCCSICLGEYKDEDWVRQLPDCRHVFHVDCIARWFGLHGTCPLCRTSAALTAVPQRFSNFFVPFAR